MKPALAIMQNMWVREPDRMRKAFETHGEEFRLRFIKYALFAGCLTGRRIRGAFGDDLVDKIIWEESTREIAGDAKTVFPPALEHIRNIIVKYQPLIVIAFGKIAAEATFQVLQKNGITKPHMLKFVTCPHPAARQPDTMERLREAAEKVRREL